MKIRKSREMKTSTDKSLKDTGERMIPAYHKGHLVYGEHIVRYQAATTLVEGKVVLDIASGSGYGSAFLGTTAKLVYGVDINADAIAYAKKNYASKNVSFIKGDGIKIPLEDNAVDVVVSFETIEHIEDYKTFMKEVKRVLKDDGLLILSTPNDAEFPESNHFHIYEFEHKELKELIAKFFRQTKWYFEATWLSNALLDRQKLTEEWEERLYTYQTAPIPLKKCLSFFVLCANRPISESIEPLAAIAEHYSERSRQEYEQSIRKHIDDQSVIMHHQERALAEKDATIQQLQAELSSIHKHIERLRGSLPGRIYRFLRVKRFKK